MIKDKTKQELFQEFQLTDIQEPLDKMVEIIGLENVLKLVYNFGGLRIYVPKLETFTASARDRLICQQFDGGNYNELARKFGITEVWVRQVVNRDRGQKNQIDLFGA